MTKFLNEVGNVIRKHNKATDDRLVLVRTADHAKIYRDGKYLVSCSSSPSDPNALRNIARDLFRYHKIALHSVKR